MYICIRREKMRKLLSHARFPSFSLTYLSHSTLLFFNNHHKINKKNTKATVSTNKMIKKKKKIELMMIKIIISWRRNWFRKFKDLNKKSSLKLSRQSPCNMFLTFLLNVKFDMADLRQLCCLQLSKMTL